MRALNRLVIILLMVSGFILVPSSAGEPSGHEAMEQYLGDITGEITDTLLDLQAANEESAARIGEHWNESAQLKEILTTKIETVPAGKSSLIIDQNGTVLMAAPAIQESLIGHDLGYQPEVQEANRLQEPILSSVFPLEEGFSGISLSYPVFSAENDYLGYTDITFSPQDLIGEIIRPILKNTPYDLMILQTDGLVIYETNPEEVGRNVLTDTLYSSDEMKTVSSAITTEPEGTATYRFWNRNWNEETSREITWKTLAFNERKWVIAIIGDSEDTLTASGDEPEPSPSALRDEIREITLFVENATDFARATGAEDARLAFNNLSGQFVDGERYIFAYDMNGTCLALPYQPGLIGENRMNNTDPNGNRYIELLTDLARDGGGATYYLYQNPDQGYENQMKYVVVRPVDESWFIGSGLYLPGVDAAVSGEEKNDLVTRVRTASTAGETMGRETAVAGFTDVVAYDMHGTALARPDTPDLVGKNLLDEEDSFESRVILLARNVAGRGGGFIYAVSENPGTGLNELALWYVEPVDDTWFVGSSMNLGAVA